MKLLDVSGDSNSNLVHGFLHSSDVHSPSSDSATAAPHSDLPNKDLHSNFPLSSGADSHEPSVHSFNKTSHGLQVFSRENLILEQEKDPDISSLLNKALSEDEISSVPIGFYFQNGVLMRKWRPTDVPADADWTVKHQVVLPKPFRNEVLSIAHENSLAGHLGVTKTYYKVLNHFFWPRMKKDVSKFRRGYYCGYR